ncbi:MAG: TadE family protein [Rickettsiales bacterium]
MMMKKAIKSLFSDKQGLALVEFALIVPLLLILFFGTVELARYIIIMQKVERSAYVLSNMTVQYLPISSWVDNPLELDVDSINDEILPQFKKSMSPYNADADLVAVITSMSRTSNDDANSSLRINWQRVGGGSLGTGINSIINNLEPTNIPSTSANGAAAGTNPSFPQSLDSKLMDGTLSPMAKDENMIVVEVFYKYRPIISGFLGGIGSISLGDSILKSQVYSRPRQGALITLIRPSAPLPPDPPPVETVTCKRNESYIPVQYCWTDNNFNTCIARTTCQKCLTQMVCTKCITPYKGTKSCFHAWDYYENCNPESSYKKIAGCTIPAPKPTEPTPITQTPITPIPTESLPQPPKG